MALPTTIVASALTGDQNSYHGPFISSGGNVYTIIKQNSAGTLEAYKATDPTTSFAAQDTGNRPVMSGATDDVLSMNVYQDGDLLHVVTQNANNEVYYARFSMATDAWINVAASDRDILIDATGSNVSDRACDITVRSDGDIVVVYQGATDNVHGTRYERIDVNVSTDSGATWGGPTQVDAGGQVNQVAPRIVIPPSNSDQAHIFWNDATNLLQRGFSSGDVLRTERDTGFNVNGTPIYPAGRAIGFSRSSTSKVRLPFDSSTNAGDTSALAFDSFSDDSSPTFSEQQIDANDLEAVNTSSVISAAADGSTVHALYRDTVATNLRSSNDQDTDSWTADALEFTGTINHVSCNIYTRDSTVRLAYIIDDGGTIKYDEMDLGGGGQTVAVGQAIETDTAFAIVPGKTVNVGLASEADTAFAILPHLGRTIAVGLASEADTALALVHSKAVNVGLASETDIGQPIVPDRAHTLGLASEADTAFPIVHSKAVVLGLASEADTAFAIVPDRAHALGLASEADTAFVVVPSLGGGGQVIAVGLASEADTAFPVVPEKTVTIGLASEADTAFPVIPDRAIAMGLAQETDSGFSITPAKDVIVGLASEVDSAFVVTPMLGSLVVKDPVIIDTYR